MREHKLPPLRPPSLPPPSSYVRSQDRAPNHSPVIGCPWRATPAPLLRRGGSCGPPGCEPLNDSGGGSVLNHDSGAALTNTPVPSGVLGLCLTVLPVDPDAVSTASSAALTHPEPWGRGQGGAVPTFNGLYLILSCNNRHEYPPFDGSGQISL